MVYSKKFVVVLKVDGRILREFNHENISEFESECSLLLPFDTEYSLLCKNLESRDAKMRIWIDGEDVLGGNAIIVRGNDFTELEGFMDSNGRVRNKFKFIQKTEQIVKHRGDKIDDGMIRIEWQYEKPKPVTVDIHNVYYYQYDWKLVNPIPCNPWYPYTPTVTCGSNISFNANAKDVEFTNTCSCDIGMSQACIPAPDEGITVKGSEANQLFNTGYIGELEPNSHVIVIRLRGEFKTSKVIVPIEVKTKIQCPTCGNVSKSGNKFCSNCGTCILEI